MEVKKMALTPEEEKRFKELMMERNAYEQQRQMMTHYSGDYGVKPESEEFQAGRTMPRWAQTTLQTAQALGFGMIPKLTGPKTGEMVRGATTQFREDYPKTAFGIDVGGSMLPGMMGVGAGPRLMSAGGRTTRLPPTIDMSAGRRIGGAAMAGGVEGGLSGFGYSDATTNPDLMKDILLNAAMGGGGGGASSAATGVLGAVSRNVGERASEKVALTESQKRLIQALIRDTPEGQDVGPYVAARLRNLGPEAALLDVGENARQLADLLATLPGKGKQELRDFVETRALTRGERMAQAGQESLETGGKRLLSTLDDLAEQRSREAGPLYRQLEGITVTDPSGTIASIVKRAEQLGATRIARSLAETQKVTRGGKGWTFKGVETGTYNASDLANIKEGLDALIEQQTDAATGKISKLGLSYAELRDKLRSELIDRTTNAETGQSVYRQALDAWAGPSATGEAANLGRTVLNRSLSADQLRKDLLKMSESEREAARIGAFEAIRDKVGTSKAGRTEMMNLVENFVPREKLELLFGSREKFDQFYRTMLAERTMREADVLGRGSQTAPRQAALGELNADVALDVGGMASGGPLQFITGATKMWNQAQLPETTRNQLARLLMMRGPQAETDVFDMEAVARKLAERRARRAAGIGGVGGAGATSATQNR
jgi:hypothetical protein